MISGMNTTNNTAAQQTKIETLVTLAAARIGRDTANYDALDTIVREAVSCGVVMTVAEVVQVYRDAETEHAAG